MAVYYTTPTALRTFLDVTSTVLSDPQAETLIEDAEDAIDEMLGGWPIDESTGRKIVQADVEAWQWSKLGRATVKLAAAIYQQPELLTRARWNREKGPDFEFEGPRGSVASSSVMLPLNQSGLRRLTGRAFPGSGTTGAGQWSPFFDSERGA